MRALVVTLFVFFLSQATAQPSITYKLDLDQIHHHELKVSVSFTGLDTDTLEIRMPNSSPGRYALHNFAKNLYNESATIDGKKTTLIRVTPFTWKIPLKDNRVTFKYTLYGNYADGTYAGFDANKVHMNMPATFVHGVGLESTKIKLILNLKDKPDWSVASQLVRENDSTFSAPNYYYFYDSPTVAGEISWSTWQVDNQTIEVALLHQGNDQEMEQYVDWIKRIVDQEKAVFGELPKFDYGKYTFICSYNPWASGDAMEHRNSTICTAQGNLAQHAPYLIGSISHEFFHAWNIERIRPKSLEPFDFDNANLSGELWFGEGFTNYYDEVALCRAGVISQDKFLKNANAVLNKVMNSPGRDIRTPIQMSHNALFVDAGTANDQTNYHNNFISYYTYGELLGLALDLSIRSNFKNLSLDDYMKYVWTTYGKTEKPYVIEDLRVALAEVTKDKAFANSFFDQYIFQPKLPDFAKLFKSVGIKMELQSPGKVYFGKVHMNEAGIISSPLLKGSALYEAGMNEGDRLLSLNGIEINEDSKLDVLTRDLKPGQVYPVTFEQVGKLKASKFTAKQDPDVILSFDKNASKESVSNRNNWLNAKK